MSMKLQRQIKGNIKEFNPNVTAIKLIEPGHEALIFENQREDQICNEELLFKKNPENNSSLV